MIKMESISVSFAGKQVLDDFSLSIASGQKLTLWGQSGSGKSTVLRSILGFAELASGSVYIQGQKLSPVTAGRLRSLFGYLPQMYDIPFQDFREMAFMLGLTKEQISHSQDLGIEMKLDRKIYQEAFRNLSGGEKQRLLLSAVLSQDKKIFLFDEPTSSLDQGIAEILYSIIQRIDAAVITVSHNQWWIQHSTNSVEVCKR